MITLRVLLEKSFGLDTYPSKAFDTHPNVLFRSILKRRQVILHHHLKEDGVSRCNNATKRVESRILHQTKADWIQENLQIFVDKSFKDVAGNSAISWMAAKGLSFSWYWNKRIHLPI